MDTIQTKNGKAVQQNLGVLFISFLASIVWMHSAGAASAFVGVDNLVSSVLTLMGAIVVLALIILLIMSLSQGQVNWGQILFGLLAIIVIGGIAANVETWLGSMGVDVDAAGVTYLQLMR